MVDFAANSTIHAIKMGFQNTTFNLESFVLESETVHVVPTCSFLHQIGISGS